MSEVKDRAYSLPNKPIFTGIAFEAGMSNEQYSINVGYQLYYNDYSISFYALGLDYINKDIYNSKTPNKSFIGSLPAAHFCVLAIPLIITKNDDNLFSDILRGFTFIPMLFVNSKTAYRLNNFHFSDGPYLLTSIFYRSKLDYFGSQDIAYWRYSHSAGLEALIKDNNVALSLSAGVSYRLDFSPNIANQNKFVPYLSLVLADGSL